MTLAAEVGGVAICMRLLSDLPYRWLILLAILILGIVVWVVSFEWIERIFGYGGLCLLVFAVASVKLHPDWGAVAHGFVPHLNTEDSVLYLYFAVGLLGAAMTPYEVYFYSSGGIEERWTPKDLGLNKANAVIGYGLGGFLSFALMIVGGTLFLAQSIEPETLGTIALGAQVPLGQIGLLLALIGILFAVGGASIDTLFAGAYNLSQFMGWEWGRYRSNAGAPRFTLSWMVLLLLALGIVMTGVDPVQLTEYAVIFSVVALPLTYLPILLVANDRSYMGRYVNGRVANTLGVVYFVIILAVSLSAIPLMILTNVGQG
jgi:Mn2+/Fe2+ NRAMP family transporter